MVIKVLIIAFVVAACFYAEYLSVKNSPEGWEDDSGFHFGRQPRPKDKK